MSDLTDRVEGAQPMAWAVLSIILYQDIEQIRRQIIMHRFIVVVEDTFNWEVD